MDSKYSLKVVYPNDTEPTKVLSNVRLEEVIKKAVEIDEQHGRDAVGFYIERVKD